MRDHGWRVSVIAGVPLLPASDSGNGRPAGWLIGRERHAGVDVFRARGTRLSKRRFVGRFTNYMTYFASACLAGLRLDRPDLIVALTDPPIIGLAACLASRRYGVPFVMSYRDVFPEVARLLEDFHVETVNAILQRVNRFLVARADRVVALGESMQRRLIDGKGAEPHKTVIIPDWADCEAIVPSPKRNAFSEAHGLADRFVVMHAGNLGLSQNLESVVGAAEYLLDLSDLVLVFVGEGVKKPALQAHRAGSGPDQRAIPAVPAEERSLQYLRRRRLLRRLVERGTVRLHRAEQAVWNPGGRPPVRGRHGA